MGVVKFILLLLHLPLKQTRSAIQIDCLWCHIALKQMVSLKPLMVLLGVTGKLLSKPVPFKPTKMVTA
jgi:hypothetical protein